MHRLTGEKERERKRVTESQHDAENPLRSNTEQEVQGNGYVCM